MDDDEPRRMALAIQAIETFHHGIQNPVRSQWWF
jgi:hypothetical protein